MSIIRKNIANIVTMTRIIGTIVMVCSEPLSKLFFIAFIYSGFSDVLDGFLARLLHIQSDLGRKLDSISDILFYTFMMIKIWPFLVEYLPAFMWWIIWSIVVIRLTLYLYTFVKKKMLMANHTIFNKITGFLLFFIPFLIKTKYFVAFAILVCSIAFIAAIYEIVLIIKDKQVTKLGK